MGQILIVLEALTGWLLLTAALLACVSRIGRTWLRRTLLVPLIAASFLLPAWFLALFIWIATGYPAYISKAVGFAVAAGAFLVAWIGVCWRGLRRGPLGAPRAGHWPRARLAIAFVVVAALTMMTFWNQDLAARQELAVIRSEASAMAASVGPPRVPDSQNAALLYEQVADLLSADKRAGGTLEPLLGRSFNRDDPKLRALLAQHRSLIVLLRQAADRPACNMGYWYSTPSVAMLLPQLNSFPDMARLLVHSAAVHSAEGRVVEAMKDLNAAFALGDRITDEPVLITVMVGVVIQAMAVRELEAVLAESEPTAETLDVLRLSETMSFGRALHRSFLMEEAIGLTAFTDNITPDQLSTLTGGGSSRQPPMPSGLPSGPFYRVFFLAEDVAGYRAYLHRLQETATRPYYAARNDLPREGPEVRNLGGLLARILLPSLVQAAEHAADADAERRACMLGLAMHRYRLEHGRFPDSLDKLAPDFVAIVPLDPFDGKPMRLARDAEGRLVVYSVGPDLSDDKGTPYDRETKKGDLTFRVGK